MRHLVLAAIVLAAPAAAATPEEQAVVAAMDDSAAGWNAGDMDRFMAIYSAAPDTSFVTKDGLLRGKAAMIERYRARYDFSDAAKRGTLSFQTLDFRLLDPTHALYIGRYTLTYADGRKQSGPTSLVFAREASGWRIIADHSS
jgi:uncharacterized protein (TIGR02246 family)